MVHEWTLKAWKDNALLCEIYRTDENTPTGEDVAAYCGQKVFDKWRSSPPCASFLENGDTSTCDGSYLTYQGYYYRDYNSYTVLPEPSITFSLAGCELGQWCDQKPVLLFDAVEPMEDYEIMEINIQSGDEIEYCLDTETCEYSPSLTEGEGIWLEFWAVSNYGDESEHQSFHIRNLYRSAGGGQYRVEILSQEASTDFAALTWDVFPTVSHPDEVFFQTLQQSSALVTDHDLYYLAGRMIHTGKVNASGCYSSGLLENGMASTCGEEAASPAIQDWQNQYNDNILQASQNYNVPPRIVKAVIAQESQFWPEPDIQYEYGLGSLSENGVDVLLSWDVDSFLQICIPTFEEENCAAGYTSLSAEQQASLRGLALRAVGSEEEIDLITRVLRANVLQINQTMRNLLDQPIALAVSYEDLWSLTLANYHAGNMCVASGVEGLIENEQELTFENYCGLISTCPTACLFVERVKDYAK